MWFKVCLWLLKYWKTLLGVILVLSLAGYIYHKSRQAERVRVEAAQAREQIKALQDELAAERAAQEAAQAARERNDKVLPETRRQSAARVDRALDADAGQRLLDDQEAVAGFEAASGVLRGKGAD